MKIGAIENLIQTLVKFQPNQILADKFSRIRLLPLKNNY
jgi:hypothetical protein